MKDFTDSLVAWWREKTNGPLYFTYTVFVLGWNWRSIQVLLDSPTLFKTPRIEYINSQIELHFLGPGLDPILNAAWSLIPPAILTYVAIRFLPYVNAWSHDIHLRHYFTRKEAWDKAQLEYERKKTTTLQQRTEVKKRQTRARTELNKVLSQDEKWEEELGSLLSDRMLTLAMEAAYTAVYRTAGSYNSNNLAFNSYSETFIEPEHLARLDVLDLIKTAGNKIALTGKGKYFLKRLQDLKMISNAS